MEWTPNELIKVSGAFWTSCALHTAVHLDMFSPLADGPLPVAELACRMHCSERGVDMLATAMAAMELVRRTPEGIALLPFAAQYLCRDAPDYMGHIIRHHHHLVPGWAQLAEAVRLGQPVRERASDVDDGDERESFLMGMFNMATMQAAQCVPHIELGARQRLLDLGGGPGSYAVQFCLRHPQLTAVIFDRPTTQPFAEQVIARYNLGQRISFVGGDYTQDVLPQGFDVVWMSHIIHGEGMEEAALLVYKAAQALRPGGLLLIQEFVVDDDRNGPVFPALFGLNMLMGTMEGMAYAESELLSLLRQAGGENIRRLPLHLPNGRGVMAAEMPL